MKTTGKGWGLPGLFHVPRRPGEHRVRRGAEHPREGCDRGRQGQKPEQVEGRDAHESAGDCPGLLLGGGEIERGYAAGCEQSAPSEARVHLLG